MNEKRARASSDVRVVAWIVGIVAVAVVSALVATSLRQSPHESAVEEAVDAFSEAIADQDGEQACLRLSREAQAELMKRKHETSCERAAEHTGVRYATLYDFGATRYGPEHKSALVPSEFATGADLQGPSGEDFGTVPYWLFPAIELEQGDGQWRIANLDWYFE